MVPTLGDNVQGPPGPLVSLPMRVDGHVNNCTTPVAPT
jgi:hypothetical protein